MTFSSRQKDFAEDKEKTILADFYYLEPEYKDLSDYQVKLSDHSKKLKESSNLDQHFVINMYILKESKTLLVCYTPTIRMPTKSASPEEKNEYQKTLAKLKEKYNNNVAEVDPEITGTAHVNGEMIQRKFDPELKEIAPQTLKLGLSEVDKTFICRSTANWKIFKLNPVVKIIFYFNDDQRSFEVNHYLLQFTLARSIPTWFAIKIVRALKLSVTIDAINHLSEERWKDFLESPDMKEFIALRFQFTLYIAAGMVCSQENRMKYQIPDDYTIVAEVIKTAKDYDIQLDLNFVPSADNFEEKSASGATSVMHAAKKGALNIMLLLLENNADYKLTDYYDSNILHYALESKNKKILEKLLTLPDIDKLLTAKNKNNISPIDLIKVNYPDIYQSLQSKQNPSYEEIINQVYTVTLQCIGDEKNPIEKKQLENFLGMLNKYMEECQKTGAEINFKSMSQIVNANKVILQMIHKAKKQQYSLQTSIYKVPQSISLKLLIRLSKVFKDLRHEQSKKQKTSQFKHKDLTP